MISRKGYAVWIALALACGSTLADEIRWAPDVAAARRAAMEYKVPVMIHFYGDNCLPCKLLEQNVYTRPEVVETLNKYFICVRVNGSQDRQMAAEYGVHSWPTDVFLGPDGKPLDQGTCKQSPGEYLGVLHNMAVLNRDRNVLLASQQSQNAKQVTSQVANYAQPALSTGQPAAGQVAPAGNVQGGPLPPAGAVAAGNPNGPNFYAQGAGVGLQQLPGSLAPNAQVTSGPMLSQNQPQAITTAVNGAGSQIAAAAGQQVLNATPGELPPMQFTAQIPPPTHPANVNPMQTMVAGAPTTPAIPATPAAPEAAANAWGQPSRVANVSAQTVDNPHFAGTPPLPGAPLPGLPTQGMPTQGMPAQHMPAQGVPVAAHQPQANSAPPLPLAHSPSLPAPSMPPLGQPGSSSAAASFDTAAPKIPASTVSFQPRGALSVEANRPTATEQSAQVAVTAPSTAPSTAAATAPAALEGFCPVTLKTQGVWTKGQPQFAVKHRGRIYHLSSQSAMQQFLQTPDASSPVLAGHDAMLFLNEGKLVEGSVQFVLYEQNSGSVMLFTSAESKQAYEQNYDRNTQALQIVLRKAGIGQ